MAGGIHALIPAKREKTAVPPVDAPVVTLTAEE